MSYEVTEALYRLATDSDKIPVGKVVTVEDEPGFATVIVKPGHATKEMLAQMTERTRAMLALGQWVRLKCGDSPDPGQRRVTESRWELAPASVFPAGFLVLPIEELGRHIWLIRDGEASEQLVAEMSEMLTAMVRAGIWVQKWPADPELGI